MGLSFDLLLTSPDLKSLSVRPTEDTKVRAVYTYLYLGCTQRQTAELFSISQSSISKWVSYYLTLKTRQEKILAGLYVSEEESADEDCLSYDSRCILTSEKEEELLAFVEKDPLSFLREIRSFVRSKFDKTISITTVHRILVRHGYSYKKCQNLVRRAKLLLITKFETNYMLDIGLVLHHQLVFIDELSFKTQVNARSYGRSPKGQSIYTVQPEMLQVQVSALHCALKGLVDFDCRGFFNHCGWIDLRNVDSPYSRPGSKLLDALTD
ncbi:hypothetical protein P9112_005066 [Eukaryota sp. TZLM1-RC]